MNEIIFTNTVMPIVSSCDYLAAAEPFLHADRITDFHVMIYVTDGCIQVTEDNIDHAIHPGELFFLKSGVRHFGRTQINRGTRWYYVHFYLVENSPAPIGAPDRTNYTTGPTRHLTENALSLLQTRLPKHLIGLEHSELEAKIISFMESYHTIDTLQQWDLHQRFFQLLSDIAHYDGTRQYPLSLADRIAEYLAKHYTEPFSANMLEQVFFLSYKHMAAVFKKEKQLTMQQYHTQMRMNTACKLLRSTLLSIGEISLMVGYSDMLYFSRCFHASVGMSPTEYRRQPHVY